LIKINQSFILSFINILQSNEYNDIYLEFTPTTYSTLDSTVFEFAIVPASNFTTNANIAVFQPNELDTDSNDIKVFPNLGKDSILISPCYNHQKNINDYIHIGRFMKRNIDQEQKINLCKTMFNEYEKELKKNPNKKLWLSTHGKGIAWFHVRIDQKSKYISYKNYK